MDRAIKEPSVVERLHSIFASLAQRGIENVVVLSNAGTNCGMQMFVVLDPKSRTPIEDDRGVYYEVSPPDGNERPSKLPDIYLSFDEAARLREIDGQPAGPIVPVISVSKVYKKLAELSQTPA